MKRILILPLALTLLSGCASDQAVLEKSIEAGLTRSLLPANTANAYVSYYLQREDGITGAEGTVTQLCITGKKMYMNLRVEDILRSLYYKDAQSDPLPADPVYQTSGTYEDSEGSSQDYTVNVYGTGRLKVMFVRTAYADFLSTGTMDEIADACEEAIAIARSLEVDTEKVSEAYSLRRDITYQKDSLQLFETLVPEEGSIAEILKNSPTASPEESTEAESQN